MGKCISPLVTDPRGARNIVPCGQCNYCLESKRAQWSFRLQQELKRSTSAVFLTFTYADDKLPRTSEGTPQLDVEHCQLFMKRLRKEAEPAKLRYYTVGEYGSQTDRPHYHSILFNLPFAFYGSLPRIWSHGHVHLGDVTPASIHYVTKYVVNRHAEYSGPTRQPPFLLCRGVRV